MDDFERESMEHAAECRRLLMRVVRDRVMQDSICAGLVELESLADMFYLGLDYAADTSDLDGAIF